MSQAENNRLRYQWLKAKLEEDILNDYKPTDKFLSQREMMARYEASFSTVDRALRELVEEGTLKRFQGKGTFICEQKPGSGGSGKKLALVMSRNVTFAPTHFYAEILMTITTEMGNDGYSFVFIYVEEDEPAAALVGRLTGREEFVGAFLVGNVSERLVEMLLTVKFPFVLVDRGTDMPGVRYIKTDNVGGAYEAVCHLIGQGHRRIGFISMRLHTSFQERYEGYCNALLDNGIKIDHGIMQRNLRDDSVLPDIRGIFERQDRPTAVFFANDSMAVKSVNALLTLGINVPGDVSIIGFDGDSISENMTPPLTTMYVDKREMGKQAVVAMRASLGGHKGGPVLLPARLLERNSIKKIN